MICPHCHKEISETGPVESDQELWFAEFWALFPRHVGKAAALKAWRRAATSEKLKDEIMAGLKAYRAEWGVLNPAAMKFVPHPATWLNQRRFEDEITHSRPKQLTCPLCHDSGQLSEPAQGDLMAFSRCSCPRGALAGLLEGTYRLSTGEMA